MKKEAQIFIKKSEKIAFDLQHRKTIKFNMGKYEESFAKGIAQFSDLEQAKQNVAKIKQEALSKLPQYLIEFEKNITKNGAEVLWAKDSSEAVEIILKIVKSNGAKLVVKSKSMTTEEIDINPVLEKHGVETLETDLGEFIVQVAGEKPYHIVTPAMHKSKTDVAKLFNEKFNTDLNSTPEELTLFVRKKLREKFVNADVGITGANFLIADKGAIALTENEGNAVLTMSMPKIHIAIAGIEKMVPKLNDLPYIWSVLSAHGTGQKITAYNSVVFGPKKDDEDTGPEKMYVILLDNGRTKIYQNEELYTSLRCIRCGACLNNCPIYRNIGGYTYNTTYSGPIGSVISPRLNGFESLKHLSFACTVCGKCTEVCPSKIDLHNLLLINRRDAVQQNMDSFLWKNGMKIYRNMFLDRSRLDKFGGSTKNLLLKMAPNAWGKLRSMPNFAKESFSKQWQNKNN